MNGTVTKTHAEHIRLANLDEWEIPKDKKGRPMHKATYVAPMSSTSNDDESSNEDPPLAKQVKRCRKQRETSSDEDDIPLMELAKRMHEKDADEEQKSVNEVVNTKIINETQNQCNESKLKGFIASNCRHVIKIVGFKL